MGTRSLTLATAGALVAGLLATAAPAHAADRDCGDFASQRAAQIFFLNNNPAADPHGLDADGDWVVCESNPAPYYYGRDPNPGGSTPAPAPVPAPAPPKVIKQWARVIRVIDGDTIKVKLADGPKRRVRILGIDTPEVYGSLECGGPEASVSMDRMLPPETKVLLVSDPTQDLKDRYKRLLRYVQKKGKSDVGRRQISKGLAVAYVYQNNPFQRTKRYKEAQRQAKKQDRGMWGFC